jgi:hypothetical protein
MLGTLEPDKADWKEHLPTLVYSYITTKNESTRYSPFELMFGGKLRFPIDSIFQLEKEDFKKYS